VNDWQVELKRARLRDQVLRRELVALTAGVALLLVMVLTAGGVSWIVTAVPAMVAGGTLGGALAERAKARRELREMGDWR
jgi:hypothetical protein